MDNFLTEEKEMQSNKDVVLQIDVESTMEENIWTTSHQKESVEISGHIMIKEGL